MKVSKIIWFDQNEGERAVNNRIAKLEKEGWEVVEHDFSIKQGLTSMDRYISVLLQKEKED